MSGVSGQEKRWLTVLSILFCWALYGLIAIVSGTIKNRLASGGVSDKLLNDSVGFCYAVSMFGVFVTWPCALIRMNASTCSALVVMVDYFTCVIDACLFFTSAVLFNDIIQPAMVMSGLRLKLFWIMATVLRLYVSILILQNLRQLRQRDICLNRHKRYSAPKLTRIYSTPEQRVNFKPKKLPVIKSIPLNGKFNYFDLLDKVEAL
ncbi:hypothetical protein MP638_001546 [Amoeboaphelidium occidentale]|nr:hypothetical protein MP638_001546 [Amoeboaphelidium occidentale]